MKKIKKDKIINIDKNLFDDKFLFSYLGDKKYLKDVKIIYMSELLKKRENKKLKENLGNKYAIYSNVYSPKDELEIFINIFNNAIKNNEKTHIIGITLKEEIQILEKYYNDLGFMREDINCFVPDYSIAIVSVSVKIENLIWKGSDYKSKKDEIFFIPPIRESGQNKAMFKGINRGLIAGIEINNLDKQIMKFLTNIIKQEKILPITLAKVLYFNLIEIGFYGKKEELIINY